MTPPAKLTVLVLSLLLVFQGCPWASADPTEEAKSALLRMAKAMHTLTYMGTFAYLRNNRLDTLLFSHSVQNGQELEWLVSLNGSVHEIRRDSQGVTCIAPDTQAVESWATTQLWPNLDLTNLSQFYLLHPLGEDRIAGRAVQIFGIVPKDLVRYGYRFYLDRETGLPLKTDLMDETAHPIEQIIFTTIELNHFYQHKLPLTDVKGISTEHTVKLHNFISNGYTEVNIPWSAVKLPIGFAMHGHYRWLDTSGSPVEQFLLSDGLATVSTYLEKDTNTGLRGQAKSGNVSAWGVHKAGYQITAIGEVPLNTVRAIAETVAEHILVSRH